MAIGDSLFLFIFPVSWEAYLVRLLPLSSIGVAFLGVFGACDGYGHELDTLSLFGILSNEGEESGGGSDWDRTIQRGLARQTDRRDW